MEQISQSKVIAFGDSVMWGQGIKHKNKFTTLISKNIFKIEFTKADNHAHSGAPLISNSIDQFDEPNNIEGPIFGEIPRGNPSIMRQITSYGLEIPTNKKILDNLLNVTFPNVELIFLNGGINDLDAFKLVTGKYNDYYQLSKLITFFCEDQFYKLLEETRKKFPNAQLMSIGYHFVFSIESIKSQIETFTILANEDNQAIKGYRKGVTTCHYFMGLSNAAFQKAIDKFNTIDLAKGNKGAFFTPTIHNESNATFAPKSLIWGIKNIDRVLFNLFLALINEDFTKILNSVKLEDEVIEERQLSCKFFYKDKPLDVAKCFMASLFHPNSKSAARVSEIATKTFNQFRGDISIRNFASEETLASKLKKIGFNTNSSLRQIFATNTVSSIQLKGIILKNSIAFFPYNLLEIKIEYKNKIFSYKLNNSLPGIKGFSDGKDNVYPTPTGKIVSSGGISIEKPIENDTEFNFFSFPDEILSLHEILKISITMPKILKISQPIHVNIKELELIINGRKILLINSNIILSANNKNTTEQLIYR